MNVFFHTEAPLEFSLPQDSDYKKWLFDVVYKEQATLAMLNFIFCTDDYLHKMNIDYLQHDTLTDVITFDNSDENAFIEGDIFISIDRVKENATDLNIELEEELRRVMVHGVLHLLGYKDKSTAEQALMRQKENNYLGTFFSATY